MKKNLTVVIEFAEHNLAAYIEEVDGIVAFGSSIAEIKKNIATSITVFKEEMQEEGFPLPEAIASDYELTFKYDLATFLNVYAGVLSKSGLENLTGINQKQLWHYANNTSKPRKATLDKIRQSIHAFAAELAQAEFV